MRSIPKPPSRATGKKPASFRPPSPGNVAPRSTRMPSRHDSPCRPRRSTTTLRTDRSNTSALWSTGSAHALPKHTRVGAPPRSMTSASPVPTRRWLLNRSHAPKPTPTRANRTSICTGDSSRRGGRKRNSSRPPRPAPGGAPSLALVLPALEGLLQLLHLLQDEAPPERGEQLHEDVPVQVANLVLQHVRELASRFPLVPRARAILVRHLHLVEARRLRELVRHRQSPFLQGHRARLLQDSRVDDLEERPVLAPHPRAAQRHAHLIGRDADALRLLERLEHVVQQLGEVVPEVRHRLGRRGEDLVRPDDDVPSHAVSLLPERDRVRRLCTPRPPPRQPLVSSPSASRLPKPLQFGPKRLLPALRLPRPALGFRRPALRGSPLPLRLPRPVLGFRPFPLGFRRLPLGFRRLPLGFRRLLPCLP